MLLWYCSVLEYITWVNDFFRLEILLLLIDRFYSPDFKRLFNII